MAFRRHLELSRRQNLLGPTEPTGLRLHPKMRFRRGGDVRGFDHPPTTSKLFSGELRFEKLLKEELIHMFQLRKVSRKGCLESIGTVLSYSPRVQVPEKWRFVVYLP